MVDLPVPLDAGISQPGNLRTAIKLGVLVESRGSTCSCGLLPAARLDLPNGEMDMLHQSMIPGGYTEKMARSKLAAKICD